MNYAVVEEAPETLNPKDVLAFGEGPDRASASRGFGLLGCRGGWGRWGVQRGDWGMLEIWELGFRGLA